MAGGIYVLLFQRPPQLGYFSLITDRRSMCLCHYMTDS